MESLLGYFDSIRFDLTSFGIAALVLLAGTFLLSLIGRFAFGKKSILSTAVSSVIGILFIYAVTVVLRSSGASLDAFVAPLPLVTFAGDSMFLFSFTGAHYATVCSEILSMIILAFLVNLAEGWLPKGKNIFSWVFFRCLTVAIAYILHLIVVGLFATYFPEGIVIYAPTVLLALLVILLLTGSLKIIVGALLSTVSPVIGGLYTFFFATIIGKQITKAMLTTLLLCGVVHGLQYLGIGSICIASAALAAYIPIMIILAILWYLICLLF